MCPSGATRKVTCIRHNMVENYTHSLTHSSFWNILIFDIETSIFSFLCNVLSFCLFSIPLSGLLRFKVSDYPLGIFKFFLQWWTYNAWSQDISSDLWRHEASVGLWHTYVIYRTCHNHHIEIFVGIINNVFFFIKSYNQNVLS